MSYRPNPDNQSWLDCRRRLVTTLTRWGVDSYSVDCPTSRYGSRFTDTAERFVLVTFDHPQNGYTEVRVDRFERPVDNLWAIALGLAAIRLNELRGLDDVARQVYAALPAPRERDPYEVLGIRPDAPAEVVEAAYRARAKQVHPDHGGTAEQMAELNAAYERVKGGRQ